MPNRVVFLDKGVVGWESFESEPLLPERVRIRARTSLISTGTEGICLHRAFEPGTHWDRWVTYPFRTGYCMVGTVAETAPDVTGIRIGQRVVSRVSHSSESTPLARSVFPVPDDVRDEDAVWFALAMVGFMGWKAAETRLGETVLVVGAGPVGQMACRWFLAGGTRLAVLDPISSRLSLAVSAGVDSTIRSPIAEAETEVRAAFDGSLPSVVVDTTGNASVFEKCLPLVRDRGRMVLLGDTGKPSEQRLTKDVVVRGVQIVGAHITHETAEWHEASIVSEFFRHVRKGNFKLDGMISHRFSPQNCAAAYALTTEKRDETMGVLFDWIGT